MCFVISGSNDLSLSRLRTSRQGVLGLRGAACASTVSRAASGLRDQRGDVLERTPAEVLRELADDLASQVAVVVLAHFPQSPGVGDDDQMLYGPVQAELAEERGRSCREVVLVKPPSIGVGRAGVMARTRA